MVTYSYITTRFISEETSIFIPPYAIHRDARYFKPDPDRFWPERWLSTDPNVETNQAAFLPFSIGPMNCAGKLLAQLELRMVMATLVQHFDMDLDPKWDPAQWEASLEDYFVFKKGALPVQLKLRVM